MEVLKQRAIRGGLAKLVGQGATFALRLLYIVVVSRLLSPSEFGLVAMVTAVTGVYDLFRDGGLSAAAVQQVSVTEDQKSTLFWINMLIGAVLSLLCLLTAPILVRFYNEPRLFWVTIALSTGFIFSAAGAQYTAVLQRDLRYFALTIIDVLGVLVSTVVAVAMAAKGFGYWSLVVSAIVYAAANTTMMWLVVPWRPGLPRRNAGVASMLKFGGTVTLNSLVVYVAYNLDKVLLGRFWGADALGLYTRASQLINIPTAQLNAAIGGVAFSALSPGELFLSMLPPLSSAAVAAAVAFATLTFFSHFESALARLTLGGLVTAVVYAVMLLVVMGQRTLYLGLASQLRAPSAQ